jgi:hypothetical protein
MLNQYLNPTPTLYKWDKFFVGFIPALILPFGGLAMVYLITWLNSRYNYQQNFTVEMFFTSLRNAQTFMRVSTLSCFVNAVLFFFLIKRNFYNASRGAIIATMILVMLIVGKELLF